MKKRMLVEDMQDSARTAYMYVELVGTKILDGRIVTYTFLQLENGYELRTAEPRETLEVYKSKSVVFSAKYCRSDNPEILLNESESWGHGLAEYCENLLFRRFEEEACDVGF